MEFGQSKRGIKENKNYLKIQGPEKKKNRKGEKKRY